MHSLRLTCAPLDDDVAGLDVVDDEVLRLGDRHHGVPQEASDGCWDADSSEHNYFIRDSWIVHT